MNGVMNSLFKQAEIFGKLFGCTVCLLRDRRPTQPDFRANFVLVLRRSRYSYSDLFGVGSCPGFAQMERLKDRVRVRVPRC